MKQHQHISQNHQHCIDSEDALDRSLTRIALIFGAIVLASITLLVYLR